jgi:nucleoside-diphosphate-sugar epimerase
MSSTFDPSNDLKFDGKVLVTGASGHLGANLVRRLLSDGRQVRVFLLEGSDRQPVEGLDVEICFGDLRDLESVKKATQGVETVYHTGAIVSTIEGNAQHKRRIFETNVIGTRNVLAAAREYDVTRVVVSGSFSAVGYDIDNPSRPSNEETPLYPFDNKMPYARTKEMVEHECLKAVALGQQVVVATSCAIVGPNDFGPSRVGRTLLDFANGKLRAYLPGGFEWVAAHDIVQGHILAMHRGRPGQKYIFSTEHMTLDDLLDIFSDVTGQAKPRIKLPPQVMAALAQVSSFVLSNFFPKVPQRFTPGAVRILRQGRHADTSKAKNELGFMPTSIRSAVEQAHEDFVRRGLLSPPVVVPIDGARKSTQTRAA